VDFVVLLVATRCDDWRTGAIWPHRGAMPPYETGDAAAGGGRIRITDYVVLPVVDRSTCGPIHIGVLAHETAHAFGLPDLYDYDGSSQGIGAWGLMGTGPHSTRYSPSHLSAWSKEQLGWVQVDWIHGAEQDLALAPVIHEPRVYRYDLPGRRGEYLLLENRQKIGSDRRLPGHGMLIWHVDPDRGELGVWNTDARRRAISLLVIMSQPPWLWIPGM
jgi:immune inhibitor A